VGQLNPLRTVGLALLTAAVSAGVVAGSTAASERATPPTAFPERLAPAVVGGGIATRHVDGGRVLLLRTARAAARVLPLLEQHDRKSVQHIDFTQRSVVVAFSDADKGVSVRDMRLVRTRGAAKTSVELELGLAVIPISCWSAAAPPPDVTSYAVVSVRADAASSVRGDRIASEETLRDPNPDPGCGSSRCMDCPTLPSTHQEHAVPLPAVGTPLRRAARNGAIAYETYGFYRGDASGAHITHGTIRIINADGSGDRLLTPRPDAADDKGPAWSPDGERIAFVRTLGAWGVPCNCEPLSSDIYLARADGTDVQRLTDLQPGASPSTPTWSPDGRRLAFFQTLVEGGGDPLTCSFPHGYDSRCRRDLFAVDAVTGGVTRLTHDSEWWPSKDDPTWAPDGSAIAFSEAVSGRVAESAIFLLRRGGGLSKLTRGGADWRPRWSPDSREIAFVRIRPTGGSDVYRVRIRDHRTTRLPGTFGGLFATWSPDGRRVAFGGRAGWLYLRRSDGRSTIDAIQLAPFASPAADWRPRAAR
jgi:Tol biopolymer transport system component